MGSCIVGRCTSRIDADICGAKPNILSELSGAAGAGSAIRAYVLQMPLTFAANNAGSDISATAYTVIGRNKVPASLHAACQVNSVQVFCMPAVADAHSSLADG